MRDLVFSLTWQRNTEPVGTRMNELTRWLGKRLKRQVVAKVALSYEELVASLRTDRCDLAWLPPIPRLFLERDGVVRTLLVNERVGRAVFYSVILSAQGAKVRSVEELSGTRAAWVDPWSAAGYVLPRLHLFERGIDPRKVFMEERFFGSHDAAVRAVLRGVADVTATFANLDPDGHIVTAGWKSVPDASVRVIAGVGVIPADVIAARTSLDGSIADDVAAALREALESDETRPLVQEAFDIERFREPANATETGLLRSLERAKSGKLFPHLDSGS